MRVRRAKSKERTWKWTVTLRASRTPKPTREQEQAGREMMDQERVRAH